MAKYLINSNDIEIKEVTGTDNLKLNIPSIKNAISWTPTLANAECTYDYNNGYYVKLGGLVFFWFHIKGTINNVISPGYAFINGLPYSCGYETAGSLFEYANITSNNTTGATLRIIGNQLGIQKGSEAGMSIYVLQANQGTFYIGGSGVYYTTE